MVSDARQVVLITGSSGLIGSAIVKSLAEKFTVVGFDKDGNFRSRERLAMSVEKAGPLKDEIRIVERTPVEACDGQAETEQRSREQPHTAQGLSFGAH